MTINHTDLKGSFQPAISEATVAVLREQGNSRVPGDLFRYLRAQWLKLQRAHGTFCLWETDKNLGDAIGTSKRSISDALNILVDKRLLIRIPFHSADFGITSKTQGNERRWLVPIDLGQSSRVELLQECKGLLEQTTRYRDKVKESLAWVDNLLELEGVTEQVELEELDSESAITLHWFPMANFYPENLKEKARVIALREERSRRELVAEIYKSTDFRVTEPDNLKQFEQADTEAMIEYHTMQKEALK